MEIMNNSLKSQLSREEKCWKLLKNCLKLILFSFEEAPFEGAVFGKKKDWLFYEL